MKKITFLLGGLVVAQVLFAQNVQFGLKGGLNITKVDDSRNLVVESRARYHVGALAHVHLNPNFAIQPEIMYSAEGSKYPDGVHETNYIKVPVLVQYMFSNGLRLQTGPVAGIFTDGDIEPEAGTESDIKHLVKKGDFQWSFGGGYLAPSGLGIDARYNHGITNIRKPEDYVVKNNVWQVGLFYQFRK